MHWVPWALLDLLGLFEVAPLYLSRTPGVMCGCNLGKPQVQMAVRH